MQSLYYLWLSKVEPLHEAGRIDAYFIATLYAAAGDDEEALKWLKIARQERNGFLVFVGVDPRFDSLRETGEFADILQSVFPNP